MVLFVQQKLKYDYVTHMAEMNRVAVNGLQLGLFDRETFPSYQVIDFNDFCSWVKTLKDHRTSIYGTGIARSYGQCLDSGYRINNNLCTGEISGIGYPSTIQPLVADSSSFGLKLSGWAWSRQPGISPPSRILLVDQHNVIRGGGMFSEKSAGKYGWVAFARLDQDATEIYAYALYDKENAACLIDRSHIASPQRNLRACP
jgi:hypothetical protein